MASDMWFESQFHLDCDYAKATEIWYQIQEWEDTEWPKDYPHTQEVDYDYGRDSLDITWDQEYPPDDEYLGKLYRFCKKHFGVGIAGYGLLECDGCRYRAEFDRCGRIHYEELDWLATCSRTDIAKLREYAKKRGYLKEE